MHTKFHLATYFPTHFPFATRFHDAHPSHPTIRVIWVLASKTSLRKCPHITWDETCTNEALKPGQFQSAHVLFCCGFPAQETGASLGTTRPCITSQIRVRTCCPFPHVLEQSFHGLHRDHLTSSRGQLKRWSLCYLKLMWYILFAYLIIYNLHRYFMLFCLFCSKFSSVLCMATVYTYYIEL